MKVCSFGLFALTLTALEAAGQASYPPIPKDKTTPTQQRLGLYGAHAVSVGWNTYEKLSNPCVHYGIASNKLDRKACSSSGSINYPTSRTWSNTVVIDGLKPATKYYYKIDSTNSTTEFFLSGRVAGDKTPFTLNNVPDLGVYGEDGFTLPTDDKSKRDQIPQVQPALNHTTIGALARTVDNYELVLHPGDFAYADDWFEKPKNLLDGTNAYQAILEQFYQQLAPVAGRKPYMVSPGNHEVDCSEVPGQNLLCPPGQRNFSDFMNRFSKTMPTGFGSTSANSSAQVSANRAKALAAPPFWYSFEYGMATVIMINTETDYPDSLDGPGTTLNGGPIAAQGQQLQFLEAALQSVDRSVTPWIVVAGHRPWYSTGDGSNVCKPCQKAFEPLLYKYGVDVAVFGHIHNSQLFRPTYNGTADAAGYKNPKAPMYVVSGGGGNIEGLSAVGNRPSYNDFAYADDFSYAALTFESPTSLKVNFLRSATGQSLYTATLQKDHKDRFVVQ